MKSKIAFNFHWLKCKKKTEIDVPETMTAFFSTLPHFLQQKQHKHYNIRVTDRLNFAFKGNVRREEMGVDSKGTDTP